MSNLYHSFVELIILALFCFFICSPNHIFLVGKIVPIKTFQPAHFRFIQSINNCLQLINDPTFLTWNLITVYSRYISTHHFTVFSHYKCCIACIKKLLFRLIRYILASNKPIWVIIGGYIVPHVTWDCIKYCRVTHCSEISIIWENSLCLIEVKNLIFWNFGVCRIAFVRLVL